MGLLSSKKRRRRFEQYPIAWERSSFSRNGGLDDTKVTAVRKQAKQRVVLSRLAARILARRPQTMIMILVAVGWVVVSFLWWKEQYDDFGVGLVLSASQEQQQQQQRRRRQHAMKQGPCAITLFGLPRAFESIVLPSLIQNVIQPNAAYRCDYFVHYYNLTFEQGGRSGNGGNVNPHEIRLLTQAVHNASGALDVNVNVALALPQGTTQQQQQQQQPTVAYTMTQEAEFWTQYKDFINTTRTAVDDQGRIIRGKRGPFT